MENKNLKILLVDDDIETREMYAEIFQNANYKVMQANDGVEGLDLASREIPDVVFTGIVMPRMDGFGLMEALKKTVTTANIPVVICSHMGREEDQKRANLLGAKDFIMRDITPPREVLKRVNALFLKEGKTYQVEFNPFSLDSQKIALELGFNQNFSCLDCGEKTVLTLKLTKPKDRIFEAKFICPKCGWTAK